MQKRKYYKNIWADFNKDKEMVFISGARQTGKTTLAKDIASEEPVSRYFNYDVPENKAKILAKPSFFEEIDRKKNDKPLIILDEIHKYKEWKNYFKRFKRRSLQKKLRRNASRYSSKRRNQINT